MEGLPVEGTFEISMLLSKERSIKMIGPTYVGEPADALNARIDRFQDALDRQFVRIDLTSKKAEADALGVGLERMLEEYNLLDEKRKNPGVKKGERLSSVELQRISAFDTNFKAMKERYESLKAAIPKAEERLKLNGAHPAP